MCMHVCASLCVCANCKSAVFPFTRCSKYMSNVCIIHCARSYIPWNASVYVHSCSARRRQHKSTTEDMYFVCVSVWPCIYLVCMCVCACVYCVCALLVEHAAPGLCRNMIVSTATARLISCELSALVTSAHEHDSITTETDGSSSGRWRKRSHIPHAHMAGAFRSALAFIIIHRVMSFCCVRRVWRQPDSECWCCLPFPPQGRGEAEGVSGHPPQGAGPADPPADAGGPGSRDGLRVPPLPRLQGEDVRHPHVDPGQLQASARLFSYSSIGPCFLSRSPSSRDRHVFHVHWLRGQR